jgi:cysteine sulfinate desulfinase/cysteine desulfurase-like protein
VSAGDAVPGRVSLDYRGFAPVDPRVLAVMRPFLEAGFTLGRFSTVADLEAVLRHVPRIVSRLRALAPLVRR